MRVLPVIENRQSRVLIEITIDDHGDIHPAYIWWCPGCAAWGDLHEALAPGSTASGIGTHMFHIPPWSFDNDDMDSPTFSASYLVHGIPANPDASREHYPNGYSGSPRCHSFVKDGHVQYLSDSEHPLAGQTVPMAPVPAWLRA